MKWNNHLRLTNTHAPLGASTSSWLRYSDERLQEYFRSKDKAKEGTEIHSLAAQLISRRIKLSPHKKALNLYVNDCIGFLMDPEVVLFYSEYIYGTADAISFSEGVLRIFDLKTGIITVKNFEQLMVYAALFCLEYNQDPSEIGIVLRYYQDNQFIEYEPEFEDVQEVMDKIIHAHIVASKLHEVPSTLYADGAPLR